MTEFVLSFIAAMLAGIFVILMHIRNDILEFIDDMYEEFEEEKEEKEDAK